MVFDAPSKTLYIFAGQRDEKYLSDMYTYNVETGIATEIFSNFSAAGGPDACFTQRAVIDTSLREIYVYVDHYALLATYKNANSSFMQVLWFDKDSNAKPSESHFRQSLK